MQTLRGAHSVVALTRATHARPKGMLGELVAHGGANVAITFAVVTVCGGYSLEVGDRFDIPDDDIAHKGHRTGCPEESLPNLL